jgi:arylsulfatase A-like enzyme
LAACISTPSLWGNDPLAVSILAATVTSTQTPTPTATITPSPTATIVPSATLLPGNTALPTITPQVEGVKRVLIISYDGMRPDAIALAPMPNLLALIDQGAYTLTTAQTIGYPATLPSHASMLSGLCMDKTGIYLDKYYAYMGYSKGVDIFDLAHAAGMKTVMVVGKSKLRQLAEPETTDFFEVDYGEKAISKAAVEQISTGFDLMFVHFAGPDLRGHEYGWMSDSYFAVMRDGDVALGNILQALADNGLRDSTLIIVTADHGGHGKAHIGTTIEDYRIPWIAAGPGIVHKDLTSIIGTVDTAATAAYALGLSLQADWSGIPVYEAFGQPIIKKHNSPVCR